MEKVFFFDQNQSLNGSNAEKLRVKSVYHRWVDTILNPLDGADAVTSLYADDAILFPTLSSKPHMGKEMIHSYFVFFLTLKDLKVDTKFVITKVYGDLAMNAGYLEISHKDGENRKLIKARFNFWYQKVDEQWKIIFHQSSILPNDFLT